MFYLIAQDEGRVVLVDIDSHAKSLAERIPAMLKENPASFPVVVDDKVMKAGFLVAENVVVA